MVVRTIFLILFVGLAGCASGESGTPEPSTNNDPLIFPDQGDDQPDSDTEPDMGPEPEPDMDEDIGPGVVGGEIELTQTGQRRTVLFQGIVLRPEGAIDGEVLIDDGLIVCVDASCESHPAAAEATVLKTNGIISPGLIDGHNHLPYNFLPEWTAEGRIFDNRYQWADDPSYENHVLPYSANRSRGTHFCPGARWGEFRSILHGTTTVMGQSLNQNCTQGLVRNADHEHELQYNHMRTTIASPRDINDAQADNYMASFTQPVEPVTRFAVHMGEGLVGNNIDLEFSSFAGRDTRTNRHAGLSLLYPGTAILIHSLAVTEDELLEVRDTDSKIVWSPSSNFSLYGQTIDIERVIELGILTGIGPDWTVSGEPDLLAEMRYALNYATQVGIDDVVTPKKIWEMATSDGAVVVGLDEFIGTLEVGKRADIVIFRQSFEDPFESVVRARSADVQMVFIDGDAFYGPGAFGGIFRRNVYCENFDTCGEERFLCVVDDPNISNVFDVPGTRTALYNIMEGIGYPEEEQYGRGDEILDLVFCP